MTESKSTDQISRRKFLKLAALGATGVATGALIGNEAKKIIEREIKTSVGTFVPLYEKHDTGIDVDDIPNQFDVYFREFALTFERKDGPVNTFTIDKEGLFRTFHAVPAYSGTQRAASIEAIPQAVFEKIAQTDGKLMFGDIVSRPFNTLEEARNAISLQLLAAVSAGAANLVGRDMLKDKPTRRKFLSILSTTAIGVALSRIITTGIRERVETSLPNPKQTALRRIIARLNGLASDLHPEEIQIFFRNAIMANNLLEVASTLKEKGNDNPKIVYQMEGAHSGVEDFLQMGQDFCRTVILSFPTDILRQLMQSNIDIASLASSRLLSVPREPIFDEQGAPRKEALAQIQDTRIIDTTLQTMLSNKLFGESNQNARQ